MGHLQPHCEPQCTDIGRACRIWHQASQTEKKRKLAFWPRAICVVILTNKYRVVFIFIYFSLFKGTVCVCVCMCLCMFFFYHIFIVSFTRVIASCSCHHT